MVSLINFGNLKQVNGRTVSSGSQSGLDTVSIIEQLANAKRLPAVKFEDNIKINNSKISALTELKSRITALQEAVGRLRNPVGFSASSSNAFDTRTAYMTMSNGSTASNYVGVTAANGAPIGKFDLNVVNLAVAESDLSESFSSLSASVVAGDASGGPGTGKFNAGTFEIAYNDDDGNPQTETVTLTAGSNLSTVRDTINAKSNTTGVKATIIKFAENDYRLKLYSDETGTTNGFNFTAVSGTSVNFTNTAAEDAEFELDGETITRSGNVVDDLIANTTISLYQETAGATITVDIDKDNAGVATGIADFLTAYNDFRTFAAMQTETDENGKLKETASLYNSPVLDAVTSKLASILGGSKGAGLLSPDQLKLYKDPNAALAAPTSLADLGIYFTDVPAVTDGDASVPAVENMLELDVTQLNDYLQKYFSQTRELFEFNFSSDNSEISSYTRSNAVFDNNIGSFSMSIDHTLKTVSITDLKDANGVAMVPATTTMTYDDSSGTVVLEGVEGTVLEGMEFFFTGTASGITTSNIQVSQGVGDAVFNSLDSYLEGLSGALGAIDEEIESLEGQNDSAQDSIDRIDAMVTTYRDNLLDKFAALEALVSASNQTLMLLDAQSNAAQNS